MVTKGIVVQDECIETPLMTSDHGVSLIRIPPPRDHSDLLDISNWNLKDVVWAGKLRFIEKEQLQSETSNTSIDDKELIFGLIQFINSDGRTFAETKYDIDGESVKITSSKRSFRVLIEYEGKKIAFGLIFLDSAKAQDFSIALQALRRDAKASIQARSEINNGLSGTIQNLHLHDPQIGPDADYNDNDNDNDDDEFGEFVTG